MPAPFASIPIGDLLSGGALLLSLLVALSILWSTLRTGVSPMPSSYIARTTLLTRLRLTRPGPILELGAGWGSLAIPIAQQFNDRKVIAYELSPVPAAICWLRARGQGLSNLEVRCKNFARADLTGAALMVTFLGPGAMRKLARRLERGPVHSTLLSHTFHLPGHRERARWSCNDAHHSTMYRYEIDRD